MWEAVIVTEGEMILSNESRIEDEADEFGGAEAAFADSVEPSVRTGKIKGHSGTEHGSKELTAGSETDGGATGSDMGDFDSVV